MCLFCSCFVFPGVCALEPCGSLLHEQRHLSINHVEVSHGHLILFPYSLYLFGFGGILVKLAGIMLLVDVFLNRNLSQSNDTAGTIRSVGPQSSNGTEGTIRSVGPQPSTSANVESEGIECVTFNETAEIQEISTIATPGVTGHSRTSMAFIDEHGDTRETTSTFIDEKTDTSITTRVSVHESKDNPRATLERAYENTQNARTTMAIAYEQGDTSISKSTVGNDNADTSGTTNALVNENTDNHGTTNKRAYENVENIKTLGTVNHTNTENCIHTFKHTNNLEAIHELSRENTNSLETSVVVTHENDVSWGTKIHPEYEVLHTSVFADSNTYEIVKVTETQTAKGTKTDIITTESGFELEAILACHHYKNTTLLDDSTETNITTEAKITSNIAEKPLNPLEAEEYIAVVNESSEPAASELKLENKAHSETVDRVHHTVIDVHFPVDPIYTNAEETESNELCNKEADEISAYSAEVSDMEDEIIVKCNHALNTTINM